MATARGPAPDTAAVVLASASRTRAAMLEAAGIAFAVDAPGVDEEAIRVAMRAEGAEAAEVALTLAEHKASRVSGRRPEAFVIGADQILATEGGWLDKPTDREEARAQLEALRGRAHTLETAVCVARAGSVIWRHAERPRLLMRPFSERFLERYLESLSDDALASVGAYQLEGLGIQLFSRIDGDYFAVLGLHLLPLLDFLRGHGVVTE